MSLLKKQLLELEEILKSLELKLEGDIEAAKLASEPVKLDQQAVGRVSRIDAIQQQQMQLAAVQRMRQRQTMVKSALSRLYTDEFGFCGNCEEPISFERLTVRPESVLCISCANK